MAGAGRLGQRLTCDARSEVVSSCETGLGAISEHRPGCGSRVLIVLASIGTISVGDEARLNCR